MAAQRVSSLRLDSWSLRSTLEACDSTVFTEMNSREREVMQLLARGYTYREIGSRLFISVKTVESHASNVLRKLQLSNRNELTRWAATNRLL